MTKRDWTIEKIREWVDSQDGPDYWYQTISVKEGIVTPGTVDSKRRFKMFGLPEDLSGKTVLDAGCNSGMIALECKKMNAKRVVGIDLQRNRLEQARTLSEIMDLNVEFKEMSLFDAPALGKFDIVFCIAVLTEVTDLIGGLTALMNVTKGVLYLELATMETFPENLTALGFNWARLFQLNIESVPFALLQWFFPRRFHSALCGTAKLRRINSKLMQGWSFVPDRHFIKSMFKEQFEIGDLGMSVRYNLFKFTRKPCKDK